MTQKPNSTKNQNGTACTETWTEFFEYLESVRQSSDDEYERKIFTWNRLLEECSDQLDFDRDEILDNVNARHSCDPIAEGAYD